MEPRTQQLRVGFTGTRHGMTTAQLVAFAEVLPDETTWFRHGCCVGADHEAVEHVADIRPPRPQIFGAPSNLKAFTSQLALDLCDDTTGTLDDPLTRNRIIVDGCNLLIACPREMHESPKGGTWYTVRYARKQGKRIVIVWPDGTTTSEGK